MLLFFNPHYIYLINPCIRNLSPSVAIVLHPTARSVLSSPGLASWDLAYVVAMDSVLRRTHASFMLLPSWDSSSSFFFFEQATLCFQFTLGLTDYWASPLILLGLQAPPTWTYHLPTPVYSQPCAGIPPCTHFFFLPSVDTLLISLWFWLPALGYHTTPHPMLTLT